ncbi:MAG: hypothetical protein AB7Q45_25965 [Planctomycetaceae bacterium]
MSGLIERCQKRVAGVLECPDRAVIQGTLPTACYADGMTRFLSTCMTRIFDYAQFTKPLKDALHENAKRRAAEAGVE